MYILTCLATNLPIYVPLNLPTHPPIHLLSTYLFIYLLTYPPTYLLIIYTMLIFVNVWYTKYEGIALNELTTILIIFDPKTSINKSLECGYYKFDQLLWPTCNIAYFDIY
jgi:hypothetical protein